MTLITERAGSARKHDNLASSLPYLRRYARSVTGRQSSGDAMVRATLEASLNDPALLAEMNGGAVGLFRAFTKVWTSADADFVGGGPGFTGAAAAQTPSQIARVPSAPRQALLLNQLEDFSIEQTGEILGVSAEEAAELVKQAIRDLALDRPADVLIIEDETMIANHLEDIVTQAGHHVIGNATTASEARAIFAEKRPGLVLSDMQLADGSSGADAVDEILRLSDVPVIFITAYPELLLTGERPEPAFLIGKPFRDETVCAAISQALFFGSNVEK